MFFLCGFLRNLFPPLTVFDLHKVSWIHASLRRIRDGPCIYTTTRGTQRFRPFVQPNLATLEGCLLQRERNALQYRNVVLEKHSLKRVEPINRHPCHHHRLTPGIYSPEYRSSHPQNHPASLLGCRQESAKQSSPTDSRPSLDTESTRNGLLLLVTLHSTLALTKPSGPPMAHSSDSHSVRRTRARDRKS